MKKIIFISTFILIATLTFSQVQENDKNFNLGVEAYNSGNYVNAIRYFTLSINELSTTNAIINRAISYYYIGDSCSFCKDLKTAYGMNDTTARKLYMENCTTSCRIGKIPDSIKSENPNAKYLEINFSKCFHDSTVMVFFKNTERTWWKDISSLPDNAYIIVETMPQFPGGDEALRKYLATNLDYSKSAALNGIKGTVYVQFIVATNGAITNVRVLRGIGGECDAVAIRVVEMMPKWIPGKQNGKFVRVKYNLPLHFGPRG